MLCGLPNQIPLREERQSLLCAPCWREPHSCSRAEALWLFSAHQPLIRFFLSDVLFIFFRFSASSGIHPQNLSAFLKPQKQFQTGVKSSRKTYFFRTSRKSKIFDKFRSKDF